MGTNTNSQPDIILSENLQHSSLKTMSPPNPSPWGSENYVEKRMKEWKRGRHQGLLDKSDWYTHTLRDCRCTGPVWVLVLGGKQKHSPSLRLSPIDKILANETLVFFQGFH